MKSYATAFSLAAMASTVAAHGYLVSPEPRRPADAYKAACGQQVYSMFSSDINGNVQGALQIAAQQSDYNAAECNIWLCKGMKYEDNTANVQSWTAGQTVAIEANIAAPHTGSANVSVVDTASGAVIGSPLKSWDIYASTATGPTADQKNFSVTIPDDLGTKCSEAGACVLQWYWNAPPPVDQTYESCIDFTVGGSGSPAPAPAASSSVAAVAPSSTAAAAISSAAAAVTPVAAASSTALPVENAQTSSAVASPAPSTVASTPSTGSTLPDEFTVQQFISWLKETTGTSSSKRSAERRHPRAF